jgi:hypothetical protein
MKEYLLNPKFKKIKHCIILLKNPSNMRVVILMSSAIEVSAVVACI